MNGFKDARVKGLKDTIPLYRSREECTGNSVQGWIPCTDLYNGFIPHPH